MAELNVSKFVKESLKFKGSVDVNKTTAQKLKELEKKGVQINLMLAEILDGLDFESMFRELNGEEKNEEKNAAADVGSEYE